MISPDAFDYMSALAEDLTNDRDAWRARAEQAEARLDQPCGSCHPCLNWADETWRREGRKPPHVYEWDEMRARLAKVEALCREYQSDTTPTTREEVAEDFRAALAPPEDQEGQR